MELQNLILIVLSLFYIYITRLIKKKKVNISFIIILHLILVL